MRTPPNRFTLNAFEEALQQALKLFDQPERLGNESPLAAPYFLWHALRFQPNATSQKLRGETLRHEITQAALQLWGDAPLTSAAELNAALQKELGNKESPHYAYLLLELQYFQQYLAPRTPAAIYDDLLHVSKASFYRSLTQAIQQLGNALLLRLQPTLRVEQPFQNATLIGYQTQFEQCYGALQAGQSVALIGPGGVGKTTLATKVAQSLADHPLFWFTFRNSLTDHLDSLLMALGHFFVEQGATATWQFLLASGGKVENYHLAKIGRASCRERV